MTTAIYGFVFAALFIGLIGAVAALVQKLRAARRLAHQLGEMLTLCPGLSLHGPDGRLQHLSADVAEVLGVNGAIAKGRTFADLGLSAGFIAAWTALGEEVPVAVSATRTVALGQRFLRCDLRRSAVVRGVTACIWNDVTATHHEAQRLVGREVQFNCMFTHAPVGLAILNKGQRYEEVNPALCTLLDFSREELLALPYAAMCHPEDLSAELAAMVKLNNGEASVVQYKRRYQAKDGRVIWTVVTSSNCQDAAGRFLGIMRIIIDLSDKELLREHEYMMQALRTSNQNLERYTSIVSHDLHDPLRSVSAHLSLISARLGANLDNATRRHLEAATSAAMRMRDMIRDLTAYSRITADHNPREPTPFVELVAAAQQDLSELITTTGAQFKIGPLPALTVDRSHWTMVFRHLIANALTFRRADPPSVHINAEPIGQEWRFTVADNGIGVPLAQVEEVFRVFYRLHGRKEYPGTGIGLALCRKIVESHAGRIWMESEVGVGSNVIFVLRQA